MDPMSTFITCEKCGKKIEFERPLFCPFCGGKLEPVDGLVSGDESELYPWSNVAPLLMRIFMAWFLLAILLTWILGKRAFVIVSAFFILILAGVFLLSLIKPSDDDAASP